MFYCLSLLAIVALGRSSSVTTNTTAVRDKRVFSLFSIVQFPNQDCTTTDTNTPTGVCVTSEECTSGSGSAAGQCAAGFGVCCIFKSTTCGESLSKNASYVQNPGFPSTYKTTGSCDYKINKLDNSICQMRLDFESLVLAGHSDGSCGSTATAATDSLTVIGETNGKNPPVICHTNTGHHMYVEVGSSDNDQISLQFNLDDTAGTATTLGSMLRKWNIRVTQIPCGEVPSDCVQYFMGTEGVVSSYGFPSGQLLSQQNYKACIRQELGYCAVTWHATTRTTPSSFLLVGETDYPVTSIITAAGAGESSLAKCTETYVGIPGAIGYSNLGTIETLETFCGDGWFVDGTTDAPLGPIKTFATPFRLDVFSSVNTAIVTRAGKTGFELSYKQIQCGSQH